jgi:hypothetical protein
LDASREEMRDLSEVVSDSVDVEEDLSVAISLSSEERVFSI